MRRFVVSFIFALSLVGITFATSGSAGFAGILSTKPEYIKLELNYIDGEGKSIKGMTTRKVRAEKLSPTNIKLPLWTNSSYKFKEAKYSKDGGFLEKVELSNPKSLNFSLDRGVKKVVIYFVYDPYVNVSLSSIATGRISGGDYNIATVSVRNSGKQPVYSAFVVFEAAGVKYERQIDLPPSKTIVMPFTWKAPVQSGSITLKGEVILGGEYAGYNKSEKRTVKFVSRKVEIAKSKF